MHRLVYLLFFPLLLWSCSTYQSANTRVKVTTTKQKGKSARKLTTTKSQNTTAKSTSTASYKNNQNRDNQSENPQILEATTQVKVTTKIVEEYIDRFKEIAISQMKTYGIPASITLSQGILESGAGTGSLSKLANNHFGIKCHKEWKGPSVFHDDDAKGECFRKYDDAGESYRDHSLFLTTRSRYANLFMLDKSDYAAWAKGLKAAGYATDPKYPEKLITIIERYKLYIYDAQVLGVTTQENPSAVASSDQEQIYHVVPGDTLYSLARRFNMTVQELKEKNNISEDTLSVGQPLRIR